MTKFVRKEYVILEGGVVNEPEPAINEPSHIVDPELLNSPLLPPARQRYNMIRDCYAAGLSHGTKVIRARHCDLAYIDNEALHGEVVKFLFCMWQGMTEYKPILVKFPFGTDYIKVPFKLEEIELLSTAQSMLKPKKQVETMTAKIIADIERERSVVPFRRPVISLPYKKET